MNDLPQEIEEVQEVHQDQLKTVGQIDYAALHKNEMHAMKMFEDKFNFANPMPVEPARFSTAELGVEFWLIVVTGLASVVQASLRTGAKFMKLAENAGWGPVLEWLDGATAMVGVEGIIFSVGFVRAREEGRKLLAEGRKLDTTKELVAVGIALLISIVAGMAQSAEGSKYIPLVFQEFLDWATLFVLGAGASILAYFAGELTGIAVVRADMIWRDKWDAYNGRIEERKLKFKTEWEASPIFKSLYVDVKGATRVATSAYTRAAQTNAIARPSAKAKAPAQVKAPRTNEVRERVYEYLDRTFAMEHRIAGPSELADKLGVAKGYTGGKDGVIVHWKAERRIDIPTSESAENEAQ